MSRVIKIFGINAVREALLSKQSIKEICLSKENSARLKEVVYQCNRQGIPLLEKSVDELSLLSEGEKHQNLIAVIELKNPYSSIASFFKDQKEAANPHCFIILDEVKDPRNLGAIIRSSNYFAASAIVIPKRKSASISPLVYKASSGALHYMPIIEVTNLERTIDELKKKRDFWVYGLDAKGSLSISKTDFKGNIAIVIGSEGAGIRRLVREACDVLVRIENMGDIDSLNVSVATGIALYEIAKQRIK